MKFRHRVLAAAATAVLAASLVGCSSSEQSQPQTDPSAPVKLTIWGWLADVDKQVALYRKTHPNVEIEVVNAGVGGPSYEKLRNAIKAGSGVPDLMFMAASAVPSFVASDDLVEISDLGGKEVLANQNDFAGARTQVGDGMYLYPNGWGPLVYWYNKDVFDKYGLKVPTTWDEFAANSEKLRAANPKMYMSNFPYLDTAWAGLLWQAGQRPFAQQGTEVSVAWDGPETQKVAAYWQGLLDKDLVARVPDFTADWNQAVAQGTFASFIGGAWYSGVIAGSAPDQAGQWRVATLPQWNVGENAGADAGLAGLVIPKLSKNQAAAAEFATWFTNTDEAVQSLADIQVLYPSYKPILESPKFLSTTNPFYGDQKINETFLEAGKGIDQTYEFGPFYDYALQLQYEAVGAALQNQAPLTAGMTTMQTKLVQYASDQGYTVK